MNSDMHNQELHRLMERVEVLERRAARTRKAALVMIAGALFLLLPGYRAQGTADTQKAPDSVRASEFLVVDSSGKERARLGLGEGGAPQLLFKDEAGNTRMKLGLQKADWVVTLLDAKGKNRIGLAVDGADQPHLILQDKGAKPRLHMAVSDRGSPSIVCIHEDGQMSAGLGIHPDGRPWSRPEKEGDLTAASKPVK